MTYNLNRFEELNEGYRTMPVIPNPQIRTHRERLITAARRLSNLTRQGVPFVGKRVLEIGCGAGECSWLMSEDAKSVVGVDLLQAWPEDQYDPEPSRDLVFYETDATDRGPLLPRSFDLVVSWAAWEHISNPYAAILGAHNTLAPGGTLYLNCSLWRGVSASHAYREVFFPWPHLLFHPEVALEYYRKRHPDHPNPGFDQTVHQWRHADYESALRGAGFAIVDQSSRIRWDDPFYQEHLSTRGHHIADLRRDFSTFICRKVTT